MRSLRIAFEAYVTTVYPAGLHPDQKLQLEHVYFAAACEVFYGIDDLANASDEEITTHLVHRKQELRDYVQAVTKHPRGDSKLKPLPVFVERPPAPTTGRN